MHRFLVLFLLMGCSSAKREAPPKNDGGNGDDGKKEPIRLEIVSVRPEALTRGDTVEVHYRIVNESKDIVVLGAGRAEYGALRREKTQVTHSTMVQQATPPVFFSPHQFLLPGETRKESSSFQALSKHAQVGRRICTQNAKTIKLYLPGSGDDPIKTTYKLSSVADLKAARKGLLGAVIYFDEGKHRTLKSSRTIQLTSRSFSLDTAREKFREAEGGDAMDVRWSKPLNGWVLQSYKLTALFGEKETRRFATGSFAALGEYDSGRKSFRFKIPEKSLHVTQLASLYKTSKGDGMYTRGTFIDIPRKGLLKALTLAGKERMSVRKVFYFFTRYYYEFRPPK